MKYESVPVKSRVNDETITVGDANFAVYDSLEEAASTEGEQKCLEFVNAQVRTNEMNKVRALAKGGPSKTKLYRMAIIEISGEQWAEAAGDQLKIDEMLAVKIKEIGERMATAVPVAADD